MAGLVAKLLFLAKIDAGEIHLECSVFSVSDEIEEMCMERESAMFEAGRTLEYDEIQKALYYGDKPKIRQMINELLDNAGLYTPTGGVVRVALEQDKKQHIKILLLHYL